MMRRINGLRDIAADFDAMLIDQYGVLHDGQKLYPGASHVMQQLRIRNIPVIVMTNSGRRAAFNAARVVRMGIDAAEFVDCVSSGEVAFQSLNVKRAFVIGKDGEDYSMDGISFVARPEDAEVMLILGSNAPRMQLADYEKIFQGLTLPAVCCNPDKWMITPSGLQPAPGAIAALYEKMGGTVSWIGKPYRAIYDFALAKLGNPARVLCIGDSAEHDVEGGRGAGLSTLLVQQGVSAGLDEKDLHPRPDYIASTFVW